MRSHPQPHRRRRDAAAIASGSSVEPSAVSATAPLPKASADAFFGILALAAAGCGSAAVLLAELVAGKMPLPHFGGSPATWIVCLAFFQVTLVAAYAFANVLAVRAEPGRQILVQASLFGAAIVAMLVGTGGPTAGRFASVGAARFPGLAVAAEMATLIGLPFFAVASLGPLLADWRCHWGGAKPRHDGSDPDGPAADGLAAYRLSVAGNAGSAAVPLAYPFVIEPLAVSVVVPIGLLAAGMTTPAGIVMPLQMLAFFGGCLTLHISNKDLNFGPAVGALAADGRWPALLAWDLQAPGDDARTPSAWAVLGRNEQRMATIAANPTSSLYSWQPRRGDPAGAWTDDRSALFEVLVAWLPSLLGCQRPTSR